MASQSDAAKFFDSFAQAFDTLYDDKRNFAMRWFDRKFRSDMFIRFALTFERLGDLQGKTVLDIGCGSGPYIVEALRRGAKNTTALDPAEGMLELTRKRVDTAGFLDRCHFVEGLFPGTSLTPHDHAIVMGVMDYVPDAAGFLSALRPLVGVSAAMSFPSKHWLRTPIRALRYRLRNCPVYFYTAADINTLCSSAGFSTIDIKKIAGAGMDYHVLLKP